MSEYLISPPLLEAVFTGCGILDWQSLLSAHEKRATSWPLVSEELAAILIAVHLEGMCHFAWRFFFYGFSFESDRDRPWPRFLWVYLISGSLRILNLNLYVVLPNSGNYWPLFLECFLFPDGILWKSRGRKLKEWMSQKHSGCHQETR